MTTLANTFATHHSHALGNWFCRTMNIKNYTMGKKLAPYLVKCTRQNMYKIESEGEINALLGPFHDEG
jgi:hypothetical protein